MLYFQVSEVSPSHVRGRMLTSFNLMVCFGQMMSNVIGGVFSVCILIMSSVICNMLQYVHPNELGWRLMLGAAAIPAILQLVAFVFYLPESPRWLLSAVGEASCAEVSIMESLI